MSNNTDFKGALAGSAQANGGEKTINDLTDFVVHYEKVADDAMASSTQADHVFWTNPFDFDLQVVSASYSADNTITANDTTFATITIKTDDAAGGAPAAVASWVTNLAGTGNVAARVAEPAVITAANNRVRPGANLVFNIAKASTGVVVRAGSFAVRLRRV
jgi:hypothetical protein